MPDGNTTNLDQQAAVEVFGKNVEAAANLLGMSLEMFAERIQVNVRILRGYCLGDGTLTEERIQKIAGELGLSQETLQTDFGDREQREDALRRSLIDAGHSVVEEDTAPDAVTLELPDTITKGGDDPPAEPEQAPIWSADGLNVTFGDTTFDLKQVSVRTRTMQHIRAVQSERGFSLKELTDRAGIERSASWWSSVEKGLCRIYRDDVEKIAGALDVSVWVLLSGQGLNPVKTPRRKTRKSSTSAPPAVVLPSIPPTERQKFFRDRVLNARTEPAEGVSVGELLELARKDPAEVDWETVWLEKTKHGATVLALIAEMEKKLDCLGGTLQTVVLERVCARFTSTGDAPPLSNRGFLYFPDTALRGRRTSTLLRNMLRNKIRSSYKYPPCDD